MAILRKFVNISAHHHARLVMQNKMYGENAQTMNKTQGQVDNYLEPFLGKIKEEKVY